MNDKMPMESSEDHVKRLKKQGLEMDILQKILFLRCTQGLGLAESQQKLMNTGNYFKGPWREIPGILEL